MTAQASTAKTWGPFSGRQLTTVIVALIIGVVLLPSTVWAVDRFTNVAIQDPESGLKAKVDTTRKLTVGDGAGDLTVDGTVSAVPRPPTSPWGATRFVAGNEGKFIAGPSTTAINVTSLSFGFVDDGIAGVELHAYSVPSAATTCDQSNHLAQLYWVRQPSTAGAFAVSFPTPLQFLAPSDQKVCLRVVAIDVTVVVNVSGYYAS